MGGVKIHPLVNQRAGKAFQLNQVSSIMDTQILPLNISDSLLNYRKPHAFAWPRWKSGETVRIITVTALKYLSETGRKFYKTHVKKILTQQKMCMYIHQKMRINMFIASLFQIAQEKKISKR